MSAYLVDDATINRILAYLARWENAYAIHLAGEHAPDGGLPGLGQALFTLNCAAVDARYGAGDHRTFRDPWTPYAYAEELPPSRVEAYKALSCLLYQCAEGDVPEMPLYRALEDVRARVADAIIARLPEYDRARWG